MKLDPNGMDLSRLSGAALARAFRLMFHLRRGRARLRRQLPLGSKSGERPSAAPRRAGHEPGARNILFITVDQQRFDALGVNGSEMARTPVIDGLTESGINYQRTHVQNAVCMPSRATMLTGQHPRTHGVFANGVPLPEDAPSIAEHLRVEGGYQTALIGKAHFNPHLDPTLRFFENRAAAEGLDGPWHGFEHVEFATHGPLIGHHYADWLWNQGGQHVAGFGAVLTGTGGGDTGAPEVKHNPIPRELYHTDWVADRTIAWLRGLQDAPWFCWMSFPDPHHPFDPPLDEVRDRIDWRDMPLPERYPGSREAARSILADRPRHWLDWYDGRFRNPEGGPVGFIPGELTAEQFREINAMILVENELIDEAVGRVLKYLDEAGATETTDVFYTSDHGDLQGDYGLMFKGPYHVESLLRVPLMWRPAPGAGVAPLQIHDPVGHVDLAPTFCGIAGLPVPEWMEGRALPTAPDPSRRHVLTTFDSQFARVGMHLSTVYADGMLCTAYGRRTYNHGGRFPFYWSIWGRDSEPPTYNGTEGELYDLKEDPLGMVNLWNDPARREIRDALRAELEDSLPAAREPALEVEAPT